MADRTDANLYDHPWPGHSVKGLNDALQREIAKRDDAIRELHQAAIGMVDALADLTRFHEDPGTAALGALYQGRQAVSTASQLLPTLQPASPDDVERP